MYGMLPRVKITDLLLEVDRWTGFTRHFTHLKSRAPAADQALLLTAILADAFNLGLEKMAANRAFCSTRTYPISTCRSTRRLSTPTCAMPRTCSTDCSITNPSCVLKSTTPTPQDLPITFLRCFTRWALSLRPASVTLPTNAFTSPAKPATGRHSLRWWAVR